MDKKKMLTVEELEKGLEFVRHTKDMQKEEAFKGVKDSWPKVIGALDGDAGLKEVKSQGASIGELFERTLMRGSYIHEEEDNSWKVGVIKLPLITHPRNIYALSGNGVFFYFLPQESLPSIFTSLSRRGYDFLSKYTDEFHSFYLYIGSENLTAWIMACYIKLAEEGKGEYPDEEIKNDLDFIERIQGMIINNKDIFSIKYPSPLRGLISLSNKEEQLLYLLKYPGFKNLVDSVRFDIKQIRKNLSKVSEKIPPIIFMDNTDEEILMQMCLYAYQQGQKNSREILLYLSKNMAKLSKKEEDSLLVCHLLENWRFPLSTYSFRCYLKELFYDMDGTRLTTLGGSADNIESNYFDNLEAGEEDNFEEKITFNFQDNKSFRNYIDEPYFPIKITEASIRLAHRFRRKPETVKRWLYRKIINNGIKDSCISTERITTDGVSIVYNSFELSEEGYNMAQKLWDNKQRKTNLVKLIAKERNITERGARKLIKNHLDNGRSLDEIEKGYFKIVR